MEQKLQKPEWLKIKLTINEEEVFISQDGNFSKEYSLQPGLNTVEFKASRLLGKEVTIIKEIMYQPENNLQPIINYKQ